MTQLFVVVVQQEGRPPRPLRTLFSTIGTARGQATSMGVGRNGRTADIYRLDHDVAGATLTYLETR